MPSRLDIGRAARIVAAGGVIAYPTEAVFGIGCLARDRDAVQRVLAIKQRSWRKGLLVIGSTLEQIEDLVILPPEPRRSEIVAAWPGPVTWVLPARPSVARWLSGGRETLGVRLTGHPVAAALCERVGEAIVSTSANVSRRPPLRDARLVRRLLGSTLDYVLGGEVGGLAKPTVIKDGRTGRILRSA